MEFTLEPSLSHRRNSPLCAYMSVCLLVWRVVVAMMTLLIHQYDTINVTCFKKWKAYEVIREK